jgi:aldehyde dehydrogenase
MDQQTLIRNVVQKVLAEIDTNPAAAPTSAPIISSGANGVFSDVDQAVAAANLAQQKLIEAGVEVRRGICELLRTIPGEKADEWGRIEFEETKVGRLDHKIAKLDLLKSIPGVEYLETQAHSGDEGVSLDEYAPFGVIGAILPVTHSIPTMTANCISMIASGNAIVFNPHPSGYKCAAVAAAYYNQQISARFGIDNLITIISPPTMESASAIFRHPDIHLLVVTGGPFVARAAMKQAKRAIVAGPGNPPVVVDETADFDRAAESIIAGAAFDNNLLCIGEKEVFVVESVFEQMMDAMTRAGAARLNAAQVDRLTKAAFDWKKDHFVVSKDLVGQDVSVLATAAGANVGAGVDLLFGETDESNPFVPEEQMMPFVPFVRVKDSDEAIRLAIKHEHGFGHTAIIHSNNLKTITKMGRACNTTIFVVNGPSTAGLGLGGEGYASFSIATPTGEGITTPLTFTRFRRLSMSGSLRVI